MGYAHGELFKKEMPEFIKSVWNYLVERVEEELINYVPEWLAKMISKYGLELALDLTEIATRNYTGQHFYDEMRGMSDSTGLDYQLIVRIHMLAGLTEGKCSMFGAWGEALDTSFNSGLLQLRSLDWEMGGPFRNYPAITVYHPNQGNGHDFMTVGMMGFIGGLTGMSSKKLGISEIGVTYPDETFGEQSRIGIPFIFLLRDILQFDHSLDEATDRIVNTKRTCNLILGVGDGNINQFRAYQYSASVCNIQTDTNMMPHNATWHPRIPKVVYYGMDWICPSYNFVLSSQIKKNYGKLNPIVAIQEISAVEKSGTNHLAFYDFNHMDIYVSFAAKDGIGGPLEAYSRQFTKLNTMLLFEEKR